MSEKTEKPTPYKLLKAKQKGQVNKSIELTTSLTLLVNLCLIATLWFQVLQELQILCKQLFNSAAQFQFQLDKVQQLEHFLLLKLFHWWLPLALAAFLAAILGTVVQTGFVWATKSLNVDFSRLSISQGIKKLFSIKTCFEGVKSALKLGLTGLLVFFLLKQQLPFLLHLIEMPPNQSLFILVPFIIKIIFKLLLLLSALAMIEVFYGRWNYQKTQRMSKQEVKEEYKQKEGDPKIKARIRQLQQQFRQKTASINNIKTADVIITNPTHLAIALKYDRLVMSAPKVVCKTQGDQVIQIKKLARQYGVVIIEDKLLARTLYNNLEIDQYITSDLFPIVAPIFKEIYQIRGTL